MVRNKTVTVLGRRQMTPGYPPQGSQQFPSANTALWPLIWSHTPSSFHFFQTQGFCIHDYCVVRLQQQMENRSFMHSLTETWWLYCTSMGHESCEPEQAEPLFDLAQSLVVKAQPRQLKQPWSIYNKPTHLNHQTIICSWKVLLHFKVF